MDCYLILSITCWIALMLLCYRLNKNNSEKYVTGIVLLLLLGLLYWISYSNVCIIGFFIIILPSFMAYIIKIIVNDDIKLCCISFFLFGFSLLAILFTPNSLGDIIATIKCPPASISETTLHEIFRSLAIAFLLWFIDKLIKKCRQCILHYYKLARTWFN